MIDIIELILGLVWLGLWICLGLVAVSAVLGTIIGFILKKMGGDDDEYRLE